MHNNSPEQMPVLQNPAPNVRDREKMEGGKAFRLETEFTAAGDQPTAIKELVEGITAGEANQVLQETQKQRRNKRVPQIPKTPPFLKVQIKKTPVKPYFLAP